METLKHENLAFLPPWYVHCEGDNILEYFLYAFVPDSEVCNAHMQYKTPECNNSFSTRPASKITQVDQLYAEGIHFCHVMPALVLSAEANKGATQKGLINKDVNFTLS